MVFLTSMGMFNSNGNYDQLMQLGINVPALGPFELPLVLRSVCDLFLHDRDFRPGT